MQAVRAPVGAHDDEPLIGHPLNVRAHAFGNHADRNDHGTLVDFRGNVEWPALAVDDDLRLPDGHLHIGAGFAYVDRFCCGIVSDRGSGLLEQRAQGHENRATLHERGKDAPLLEFVGL